MTYYTLEHDGIKLDWEYTTSKDAEEEAQDWYASQFDDVPMRNGETREDVGYIIGFTLNDDNDRIEVSRERIDLVYEYYHGDLKEHGTWG